MRKLRGYEIVEKDNAYYFKDTGEPTVETWKDRPCGHCGKHNTPEGHDACLGTLPGVMNACCGHGGSNDPYVQMPNGTIYRNEDALNKIKELKLK